MPSLLPGWQLPRRHSQISIPIDALHLQCVADQRRESKVWAPAIASALAFTLGLDIAGNLAGVPVWTGHLLLADARQGRLEFMPWLTVFLHFVSIAVLGATLLRAPERYWGPLMRLASTSNGAQVSSDLMIVFGALSAALLAAATLVLAAACGGSLTEFLDFCWSSESPVSRGLLVVRLLDVLVGGVVVYAVAFVAPALTWELSRWYRVLGPRQGPHRIIYRVGEPTLASYPVYALLDSTEMQSVLVLRQDSAGYVLQEASEPLAVTRTSYVVLDLSALASSLPRKPLRLVDSAGIVALEVRIVVRPLRGTEPLECGSDVVEAIVACLATPSTASALPEAAVRDALDACVSERVGTATAQQLLEAGLELLTVASANTAWALPWDAVPGGSRARALSVAAPRLLEVAGPQLADAVGAWSRQWAVVRAGLLAMRQDLPARMRAALLSRLVRRPGHLPAEPPSLHEGMASRLLDRIGIEVLVGDVRPAPGASVRCDELASVAQRGAIDRSTRLESLALTQEAQITNLSEAACGAERTALATQLPALMPWVAGENDGHVERLLQTLHRLNNGELKGPLESPTPAGSAPSHPRAPGGETTS